MHTNCIATRAAAPRPVCCITLAHHASRPVMHTNCIATPAAAPRSVCCITTPTAPTSGRRHARRARRGSDR